MLDFYCECSHYISGTIVTSALVAIHVPVHCPFACMFPLLLLGHVNLYFVDISLMYITWCVISSPKEIHNLCSYKLHIWAICYFLKYRFVSTIIYIKVGAMQWIRQLVLGFSMWWPRFNPRSGYVGLMVGEVAMQQVFYQVPLSPASSRSTNCSIFINHLRTDMMWSSYWQHH
jgi:hypothetical protein